MTRRIEKTSRSISRTTKAVRPLPRDESTFPIGGSICQSTTFAQTELDGDPEFCYSRVGNPTVLELEHLLAQLEEAPDAVCFSTGLAAETAMFLTVLSAGDHLVVGKAVYGGTTRLINEVLLRMGITVTFVDATRTDEIEAAIQPGTRLIFVETPANPTLELTDLGAIASIARSHSVLLAVDNTFLTPLLQRPLELGADIAVYSTTKHIEGHSIALGGAVVARDQELLDRIRRIRKSTGSIQTPKNAWLTIRGLKTLHVRLERHCESAETVANWLDQHPEVKVVNYPGLESSPQHELALDQHESLGGKTRHGGILSFELHGGYTRACEFARNIQLANLAEHLGGIETLLTHPASMTHADVPRDQLENMGVRPSLLRLSVGLEDVNDLLADLEQAIGASAVPEQTPPSRRTGEKLCTVES